ncbi:hypothetical protein SAMN04487993_102854 [Salipiger marinus]|uniref:Uncharacterized protein n=1 Tax=Salipiger marinus TaxID=555512 RepID=A0A1G8TA29_9RHOB|nr:hypothetical protein SAMN04487993_102854 [Salipiger marinus]
MRRMLTFGMVLDEGSGLANRPSFPGNLASALLRREGRKLRIAPCFARQRYGPTSRVGWRNVGRLSLCPPPVAGVWSRRGPCAAMNVAVSPECRVSGMEPGHKPRTSEECGHRCERGALAKQRGSRIGQRWSAFIGPRNAAPEQALPDETANSSSHGPFGPVSGRAAAAKPRRRAGQHRPRPGAALVTCCGRQKSAVSARADYGSAVSPVGANVGRPMLLRHLDRAAPRRKRRASAKLRRLLQNRACLCIGHALNGQGAGSVAKAVEAATGRRTSFLLAGTGQMPPIVAPASTAGPCLRRRGRASETACNHILPPLAAQAEPWARRAGCRNMASQGPDHIRLCPDRHPGAAPIARKVGHRRLSGAVAPQRSEPRMPHQTCAVRQKQSACMDRKLGAGTVEARRVAGPVAGSGQAPMRQGGLTLAAGRGGWAWAPSPVRPAAAACSHGTDRRRKGHKGALKMPGRFGACTTFQCFGGSCGGRPATTLRLVAGSTGHALAGAPFRNGGASKPGSAGQAGCFAPWQSWMAFRSMTTRRADPESARRVTAACAGKAPGLWLGRHVAKLGDHDLSACGGTARGGGAGVHRCPQDSGVAR